MNADLQKKANIVRKWCLISTTEAGSGHPTSCLSAADLMTVLFTNYFSFDLQKPRNFSNDRLIFSKGHAAPLLYTMFGLSGAFHIEELKTLRKFHSSFEGHPVPSSFQYADVATGSLGQGLSVGCGMAIAMQREPILKPKPRVYVLLGDGEMAEGEVWEGANFASYYRLNNLIAIVDVNRLGQSQETMFGHNTNAYADRFHAFGWETVAINGHDFDEINKAFSLATANSTDKPFAIIAKTLKGKGVSLLENKDNWHGKPLKKDDLQKALDQLQAGDEETIFSLKKPSQTLFIDTNHQQKHTIAPLPMPTPRQGDIIATREVYGQILAQLGITNTLIYALDGDVKNSTYSQDFLKAHPDRFIECFIAEQNMVGVALGLTKLGKYPFVSTFAAFFTRAFDQIRMARISDADIKFVGSHAGVSIGEDGSSQMGLEDFALFGVLPNSVVLHPCDAISCAKLLSAIASHRGICYLRTLRAKTPVLYDATEKITIGGSKMLRSSKEDLLTIAACGITVYEALKAYEMLQKDGISVRVVDCYSIKPIDSKTLIRCVTETKENFIITVEDHFEHGGLGDFVASAISESGAHVKKMAVKKISHSGTPEQLLDDAGISASHIVAKVKSIL